MGIAVGTAEGIAVGGYVGISVGSDMGISVGGGVGISVTGPCPWVDPIDHRNKNTITINLFRHIVLIFSRSAILTVIL